ncbi:MAG: family 16 glycosylhydrolase, partial [Clostridia bacterium]|nr:family 16 glycosylhydrolase [Clostridia bacterium]
TGDSVIKNIKFSNAYINNTTSDEGVGIVIGQTSADTEFQKIYIDETCEINAPNASCVAAISPRGYTYTGGVANVTISDSAVLATINGGSYTGALVGSYWYSDATVKINRCFTASNVALTGGNRSLTESSNNYALVSDSYGTTVLTAEQMKGEAARENMTGLVFGAVWETVKNGYPVITENPIESWDGTKATTFAGGSGTADDPWLIENGAQLYKMAADYNTMNVFRGPEDQVDANGNIVAQPHFQITKDINLGNLKWYVNSIYSGSLTNTNFTKGFNGVIYGDGHTIYGLSISGSDKYSTGGLISVATQGAQIYDLHLDNGRIDQDYWNARGFAAFIGLAVGSSSSHPIIIDRCSVDNFNINSRFGSAAFVGYVYSQSVSINNSYCVNSSLSVTATDNTQNAGAFIAVANGKAEGNIITIENCYTDDAPLTVKYLDASMGTITTFDNVYTLNENIDVTGVNKVTKSELIGSAAKEALKGFNFNQVWSCGDDGEYPVHLPYEEVEYWNGREAYSYAGGDGSAEKPYEIATASQLYKLANADTASTKGKYYKLTADIAISRNYDGWQNDNPYTWAKKTAYLTGYTYGNSFAGTFDGAGHTVSGLYISEEVANGATYAYGLIPFVSANAVVKNVNIDNVKIDIDGNAYVGAIVGAVYTAESDAASPLNTAQIVAANVTKSDIATTNADTTGDIYGGAVGGVKVELCNTNELVGDILTYNYANVNETALTNISSYLLGTSDAYITDINAVEYFDIRDLVCAYEAILAKKKPVDTDSYNLVWSQEFNGTELDYSVWSRNTTMSRGSTIKYTDINSLSNGSLTLSCAETNESDENGNKIYNVNYGLDTLDTMSFKYGKLEMRAKIPFYAGAFPSLWLTSRGALGNSKITQYSTEIDIFEVFGNGAYDIEIEDLGSSTLNQNQMVACVHKWYNDQNGNQLKVDKNNIECSCGTEGTNKYVVKEINRSKTFETSNQKEAFHTIVFEWTEDEMIFKVDDTEYYTINREDVEELGFGLSEYENSEEAVHDLTGIFEQFLCVRLNNHMYTPGGAYEFTTSYGQKINTDDLDYEIDYIRLYQKNDGKSQINLK